MGGKNVSALIEKIPKQLDFSFAEHTTYGCGGRAEVAYFPETLAQAKALFSYLKNSGTDFVILGNGSNVLASDKYFDGAVICSKNLKGVTRTGPDTIFCRSGTMAGSLLKYCADNGLSGIEYLAGIPATVGGIAFMNGGAGGRYVNENITKVILYDGKMRVFSNKQCGFAYKYSTMRDIKCLILGVEFKIIPQNSKIVKTKIAEYLEKRSFHPKGKSCGCVFKNPTGLSAGKLIDEAGLKGRANGGAIVSGAHANFILNNGVCSRDVYNLIGAVKREVFERKGVLLEEEVVYIGDF